MPTYISPVLTAQGYIGATGSTPYKAATTQQVASLEAAYTHSFAGQVAKAP